MRRGSLARLVFSGGRRVHAVACAPLPSAQDFPSRPITIIVGVAPGGITDVSTRIYAEP